jgi:hypothetical protein
MICTQCDGTIYGAFVMLGDECYCDCCLMYPRKYGGCNGANDLVSELIEPLGEGCLAGLFETPVNPSPYPNDLL